MVAMIVKARTVYTKEITEKLARFGASRYPGQIVAYIFLELFMLGLVAWSIYMGISMGTTKDIIIAAVFTVVFPFLCPLVILLLPKLVARMSKSVIGGVNIYVFTDAVVYIESALPTAIGNSTFSYAHFDSVYETRDTYYLFITKQQAFVLNKSDIFEGSYYDLKYLLTSNLPPEKYIVKGRIVG